MGSLVPRLESRRSRFSWFCLDVRLSRGSRESTAPTSFMPGECLECHAFIGPAARGVYDADQGSNLLPDPHPGAGAAHVRQDGRVFGCLTDCGVTLYTAAGQQKITH